jgi:hypothetical protein
MTGARARSAAYHKDAKRLALKRHRAARAMAPRNRKSGVPEFKSLPQNRERIL